MEILVNDSHPEVWRLQWYQICTLSRVGERLISHFGDRLHPPPLPSLSSLANSIEMLSRDVKTLQWRPINNIRDSYIVVSAHFRISKIKTMNEIVFTREIVSSANFSSYPRDRISARRRELIKSVNNGYALLDVVAYEQHQAAVELTLSAIVCGNSSSIEANFIFLAASQRIERNFCNKRKWCHHLVNARNLRINM